MNVLVTGGVGFIGSHTCVELLNGGHSAIIIDNLSNSSADTVQKIEKITGKKIKFYKDDVLDAAALDRIFAENRIDAVIHFAGLKSVGESNSKPVEYYKNNVCGTISLCEAMERAGCRKMVFSSSATVYGGQNKSPFNEQCPTSAINPYGQTKLMNERILQDLCISDPRWSVISLRYFNPIGAHPSGIIGEIPSGVPNNLMPYISQVAEGILPELNVFGNDYDTPDGTGVRDYIHVVDLAEGHLSAMEYIMKNDGYEVVNLGTGKGTSVLELVAAYEKACGTKIPYRIAPRRKGDIAECYADIKKAESLLGWRALRGIEQMCADSVRFARGAYKNVK